MWLVVGTTLSSLYSSGRVIYTLQLEYPFEAIDYVTICLPLILFFISIVASFPFLKKGIAIFIVEVLIRMYPVTPPSHPTAQRQPVSRQVERYTLKRPTYFVIGIEHIFEL